ncbi:MAG: dihydropteroate synthase [Myxococcota bacterium]
MRAVGVERTKDASVAVWGVLNVTPDSFSDGGRFLATDAAVQHARRMLAEGADVIDVGGESSRPRGGTYGAGAELVDVDEELARVLPVVERLAGELGARVSIDTVKPEVACRAVRAGAEVINDVSCGRSEGLLAVAAELGAELVLMHNRRRGEVTPENTRYDDVVEDVVGELMAAVDRAATLGVARERIWVDPGIGFAKTAEQSALLLAHVKALACTGHRVLVGPSRKSFIARLAPAPDGSEPAPGQREGGTAAAVTAAVLGGAAAVRVHDVRVMRQAARVAEQLRTMGERAR